MWPFRQIWRSRGLLPATVGHFVANIVIISTLIMLTSTNYTLAMLHDFLFLTILHVHTRTGVLCLHGFQSCQQELIADIANNERTLNIKDALRWLHRLRCVYQPLPTTCIIKTHTRWTDVRQAHSEVECWPTRFTTNNQYRPILTPTRVAGVNRSSASVCMCVCVRPSVCPHDRTKTAETIHLSNLPQR